MYRLSAFVDCEMVDRTQDFVEILNHNQGYDCSKNHTRPPSLFLIKSFVTVLIFQQLSINFLKKIHFQWQQIDSFERLLLNCFDGYIGYHRSVKSTQIIMLRCVLYRCFLYYIGSFPQPLLWDS